MRSTTRNRILLSAAALALAAGGAFYFKELKTTPLLRPDDEEIVQRGAAIYARDCASCHGANLQGQPRWQERGADGLLPAPPHDANGHTWHHPEQVLFDITKDGLQNIAGPDYKTNMPTFAGKLSDEEIASVLSFIKSTWPAKHRQANDAISGIADETP